MNYPCVEITEAADFVSTPSQPVFSDQDICGANATFRDSLQNCTDSEQNAFNFTNEEELKYARRYEEGYDLFDACYEVWLQVNHPEAANRASAHDSNPVELGNQLSSSSSLLDRSSSNGTQSEVIPLCITMAKPSCDLPTYFSHFNSSSSNKVFII